MFPGFGTLVNVATVMVGSAIGLLLGHRLPNGPGTPSPTRSGWSPC